MTPDTKVRTYDPKFITMSFGPVIFSGFMDGSFVTIAKDGNNFDKKKGADGGTDRVNKNNNDYAVTFMLKQTSLTNDALSAVMIADQLDNSGIFPLIVKDLRGTTFFFAKSAWIAKDPDWDLSEEITGREWLLHTGIAEKFTGGNV